MGQPELSIGPFCLTRSNPTHQLTDPTKHNPQQVEKFGHNPTRTNTTNNGAYSLAVKYIYTLNLFELLVNQASTYSCSLLVLTHILVLLLQWTQPNPTHKKSKKILTQTDPTKPMGQPNPWTTLVSLLLTLAWWTAGLGPDLQNILRRTQEFS